MIHYIREGRVMELGLNFRRAPGGFVIWWAWYSFAKYEGTVRRFRLRLHMKPRIMWSVSRWNVIDDHLWNIDCELVPREVLADLKMVEQEAKRASAAHAKLT
jgi:hypothetical protein